MTGRLFFILLLVLPALGAKKRRAPAAVVRPLSDTGWEISDPAGYKLDPERKQAGGGFLWLRKSKVDRAYGQKSTKMRREELITISVVPFKLTADGFYPVKEVCGTQRMKEKPLVVGKHYGKRTYSYECVDPDTTDNDHQWREHYYDILPDGEAGPRVIRLRYTHSMEDIDDKDLREPALREETRTDPEEGLDVFRKFCGTSRPVGAPPESSTEPQE
jgi:hypothetical protein